MKPLTLQTPKPSSNRSRPKETPQSKRSETGSNDLKILSKTSSSDFSESSEKDALDSSSSKEKQQKIVSKNLKLDFEAVSEDLPASTLDPPLFSPDLESSVEDQELTSWISLQSAITPEITQRETGSGKTVVSVESTEAAMLTSLLKESILEFKSSSMKLLNALRADLGRQVRNTSQWSDPVLLMKLQAGLTLFLILIVALSNCILASVILTSRGEEMTGPYPT